MHSVFRTIAILSLVTLLAACQSTHKATTTDNSPLANTKVMSFNIRNAASWTITEDGTNAWPNRRASVQKMILQEKPDAIGLQEMLGDQIPFLDSVLSAAGYGRVGVGRDDGIRQGEMMAVYYNKSRFELLRSATYWLSDTPETPSRGWDGACNRTATVVLLRDLQSGRKLLYINTHLDHMGKEARKNGVLELVDLANEWGAMASAVIIGGDFNSPDTDSIFRPLRSSHLLPARTIANTTDTSMTYNGYGKGNPSQIDHFFVRGIRPTSFRVLNGNYGVPYISDHYPVSVEFGL